MTPPVAYTVRVQPGPHEIVVEMSIDAPPGETLRLEFPTWTPGDYTFFPFGRDLFTVDAMDAGGVPLAVVRDGWQAFTVDGGASPITVTYHAYAYGNDLSEPAGLVDDDFAVLLGARYLHAPSIPGPRRVTYELPDGWNVHHPSGAARLGDSTAWDYPSYDIVLDTPVVMGAFDLFERDVLGTPFYFAFVDRAIGYDSMVETFVDDVVKAVTELYAIFGSFPFADYTFVFSMNPANGWGLEHLTSTMCGLGPTVFFDPNAYSVGVSVCAHELLHAWNVRRLRPAPLMDLDLYDGTFTDGLWLAEGFTRYYEFLICARTGAYSVAQFFSSVVNYYSHLTQVPAYDRVSGTDSSLATYLNHQKYPGRCNNSIDYYDKGMIIALEIDVRLRCSASPDSLDAALRAFYDAYVGKAPGWTLADAVAFFDARLPGLGALITDTAALPGNLAAEADLATLGFTVGRAQAYVLGLIFLDGSSPNVYNVVDESPAGVAGIAPDDVLMTINGFPYSLQALQWVASRPDAVTLGVLRGHRMLSYQVFPQQRDAIVSLTWNGTSQQRDLVRAWLKSEFDPAPNQPFSLDYYDNFHGIETLV